ncbi:MAG TPA: histone deacetylase [Thermoanaerobaculia bacterium]|nr:histone deacetylase [Thermoanaerobaculia bacterium]
MLIYTNPVFRRHHTGIGHPESIDRLDSALEGINRAGLSSSLVETATVSAETDRIIAKVHSADYAAQLDAAAASGQRLFHSMDNPISSGSYAAARAAVGVALEAADEIWIRKRTERAFVIARPPGHHAERAAAMGFCFFNTIACVAEYLREQKEIERVMIFDWDVHHGNGTQHLFEERDDVYYISTHRYPFYPGTGAEDEIGIGRGQGFTRNIPFSGGVGDREYLAAVEQDVIPIIDEYRPQALLISAGFDSHYRDPLGGMRVTEHAFGEMTRRMNEVAARHCQGRVLTLLEGGYDPEGLANSVAEHVTALAES